MKKVFSKRWKLNAWDFSRAALLTAITAGLDALYQGLVIWIKEPDKPLDWEQIGGVALITFVGYILKNFSTKIPDQAVEHAAKEAGITKH